MITTQLLVHKCQLALVMQVFRVELGSLLGMESCFLVFFLLEVNLKKCVMHGGIFGLFLQTGLERLDGLFVLRIEHIAHAAVELPNVGRILQCSSWFLHFASGQSNEREGVDQFIH